MKKRYRDYLLAAIVRNTETSISVIGIQKTGYDIVFHLEYNTARISNLSELLIKTMGVAKENAGITVTKACIAAAGPVSRTRDHVHLTRSELQIVKDDIIKRTGLKAIFLLNDYEAIAYGINMINRQSDLIRLPHIDEALVPKNTEETTIAVIGSERGLGMAIARYNPEKKMYAAIPSEGGHIELACIGKEEEEFISYLKKKSRGRPGYEAVLSMEGIFTLFDYMSRKKGYSCAKTQMIAKLSGQGKLEAIQSHYHAVKACRKAMQVFITFYARMCKTLALMSQCYSGLYITDMLVLRNIRESDKNHLLRLFMQEFETSSSRAEVLQKIPVYLLTSNKAAVLGCYNYICSFQ